AGAAAVASAVAVLGAPVRRPFGSPSADALVAIADGFVAGVSKERKPSERTMVVVHIDRAALEDPSDPRDLRSELANGVPIARQAARRLACDASVVELESENGDPLRIGRKKRLINNALRRAL